MLYEMVTGRRAFAGDSTAEMLAAVVRDQPKPPSELVPDVPRELERLIQRCLRKEPERRFQHMPDVKLELEQIAEDSRSSRRVAWPVRAPRVRRRWLVTAAAGLIALSVLALWQWRGRRPAPPLQPPQLTTLVSLGGLPDGPSFSPDGEQVAFEWTGERSVKVMSPRRVYALPWNIYITMPGSSEVRQVTTGSAGDFSPSWSPDGRQIAFTRRAGDGSTLNLVSPLGGSVRQISELLVSGSPPTWSSDGRWLAASRQGQRSETAPEAGGIALFPLDGGPPRSLAPASPGGWNNLPVFSHDGRQLAFVACLASEPELPACEIQVLRVGPDLTPVGPPRTVTPQKQDIAALAWGIDDAEVLYATNYGIAHALRARVDGQLPPERLELAGSGAVRLATARSRNRLAFVRSRFNDDIYRFVPGQAPEPLAGASSFLDVVSSFSPDGQRIAFESTRSGTSETWLSAADGTSPMQLTRGPGVWQGSPRWSPDGQRIAFDSQGKDGRRDVWTVAARGGAPSRLHLGRGRR